MLFVTLPRTGDIGWLAIRQACDNMGVVGECATKGMSLKEPLATVLQSAGLFCAEQGLGLRLSRGSETHGRSPCQEAS